MRMVPVTSPVPNFMQTPRCGWCLHQDLLGVYTKSWLVSTPRVGWCLHQELVHAAMNLYPVAALPDELSIFII